MTTANQTCGLCNGTGRINHHAGRTKKVTCPTCNATGRRRIAPAADGHAVRGSLPEKAGAVVPDAQRDAG